LKPFSEGSRSKVFSLPGPVHKQVVLGGKQEWIVRLAVSLNCFVQKLHFKMEGSGSGGGLDVHLGLKDAYLSVASVQDHRKYQSFIWDRRIVPPSPLQNCGNQSCPTMKIMNNAAHPS